LKNNAKDLVKKELVFISKILIKNGKNLIMPINLMMYFLASKNLIKNGILSLKINGSHKLLTISLVKLNISICKVKFVVMGINSPLLIHIFLKLL
jgi:hypothetical protein